ncbi:unnamed protein product [Adineta steineri]|uniref:Uncharacterized protein n=1 Tax=Adineta steineri TaxID=433720 RepID=A0A819NR87_9BILA|nr:unnamed protein product [Adineta steineri]
MPPLPKVLVTKVERHRRHSITHHSKKGRVSNVVRVTRIKSRLDGSFRTNRQSVPNVNRINMSIADVNIKSTSRQEVKSDVNQPQILYSTTNRNSLKSMTNSAVPLISSVARQSTLPNRFSSKVVPSGNYDPLRSTVHSNLSSVSTTKQSRFSLAISTTSSATAITITSNICTSLFTNIAMVANCYSCPAYSYHQYIYNYTAIATVTRVAFAFRRQTSYFNLDDVSVRDYAAPTIELLSNPGFETGDLSSWIYCNQNNETITGGVQSNYTSGSYSYYPKTGTYYYMGGSLTASDYISQSFSTQIGHLYKMTLWAQYPGTGTLTSADFFLCT